MLPGEERKTRSGGKMFKKIIISASILIALVFLFNFSHAQAASLNLSPSSGKVNSQFNLTGSGLTSGFPAMVQWDDGSVLSQGTVDGSGNYSATATVPGNASVGAHTVSIAVAQPAMNPNPWWKFLIPRAMAFVPSGDYATATFTVTEDTPTPTSSPSNTSSDTPTTSDTSTTSGNQSTSQSTSSSSVDKSKSKIEVDKTEGKADGQDKITISLVLLDSQGKAITGLSPDINASGSHNTVSKIEFKNNKYVANLTSATPEEKTISAKVGKVELDSVKVKFVANLTSTTNTAATKSSDGASKKSFWSLWWWLILLIILLTIAVPLFIFFYYKKKKKKKEELAKKE